MHADIHMNNAYTFIVGLLDNCGGYQLIHEFPTLGCIEEFRLCSADKNYCPSWNTRSNIEWEIEKHLFDIGNPSPKINSAQFSTPDFMFGNVYEYLHAQTPMPDLFLQFKYREAVVSLGNPDSHH
jgi:hypothetical protein